MMNSHILRKCTTAVFAHAACILLLLLLAPAFVSAQKGVRTRSDGTPPPPRIDPGRVEGSTYTNDQFGVSFTFPADWTVIGKSMTSQLNAGAKEIFKDEKNPKLKRQLEASVDRTTPLFLASKHAPGSMEPFNASLLFATERVPTALVKTPADYLAVLLHTLRISQGLEVELVTPLKTKRVGTMTFGVYTLKLKSALGIFMQQQMITIKDQHAVGLVFTYIEESDLKAFDAVVASLKTR